jgi:hypothetical protein
MNCSLKKIRALNKVHEFFDMQMTRVSNKAERTDRTRVRGRVQLLVGLALLQRRRGRSASKARGWQREQHCHAVRARVCMGSGSPGWWRAVRARASCGRRQAR